MANKRHRQPLEIMAQMNITNLLDTAFILLITFMIVAPQLTQGIKVDLPQVEDSAVNVPDPEKAVLVNIQKIQPGDTEEAIYLMGKRVTMDELREKIATEKIARPKLSVVIEADKESRSGVFVQVLGAVKGAGVDNIDISTLPGSEKPASTKEKKDEE